INRHQHDGANRQRQEDFDECECPNFHCCVLLTSVLMRTEYSRFWAVKNTSTETCCMTFWLGSWFQGSLRRVQRNWRWPSVTSPRWSAWFQFVVTKLSSSSRCATRAASPLRSATAPASDAMCKPSTATG